MNTRSKILLSLIIVGFLSLLGLAISTPWKSMVEQQIEAALTAKGVKSTFSIADIGLHSTVFDRIRLETAAAPVVLKNVTATYAIKPLLQKDFSGIAINVGAAALSWKGGELTAKDVHIVSATRPATAFDLHIQHVSVDDLMQALTGNRVSATGTVSGSLPVIVSADGAISFGKGALKTDAPGTLNMSPESVPGSGAQIDMVRKILKDFRYQHLSIAISNDQGNHISLLLALQGNNPEVDSGRPVNLNVTLTGDVLDYIKQNVVILTDPKSLLTQESP